MAKKSKEKGKRGEREAAKFLSGLLNCSFSRGVQYQGSSDSPDVAGLKEFGLHCEVKRDEVTIGEKLYKAIQQSKNDCEGQSIPFVLSRRNKREWIIAIEADNLVEFCENVLKARDHEKNI